MRLIDADAFKEYLRKGAETNADIIPQRLVDAVLDIMDGIMLDIDEQPTIDAVPRWIPCEESLPEPNVSVLGYAPAFNNIYAVYYDSVCGWMTWSPVYDEPFPSCQGEIVAWMPLPEPYKGEREDDE